MTVYVHFVNSNRNQILETYKHAIDSSTTYD